MGQLIDNCNGLSYDYKIKHEELNSVFSAFRQTVNWIVNNQNKVPPSMNEIINRLIKLITSKGKLISDKEMAELKKLKEEQERIMTEFAKDSKKLTDAVDEFNNPSEGMSIAQQFKQAQERINQLTEQKEELTKQLTTVPPPPPRPPSMHPEHYRTVIHPSETAARLAAAAPVATNPAGAAAIAATAAIAASPKTENKSSESSTTQTQSN